MNLKLHNILKIEDADIDLVGLTVLTGENNSGKSTVGKILFSLLKATNNVRQVDRIKTLSLVKAELLALKKMLHSRVENLRLMDDVQSLSLNLMDGVVEIDELKQALEHEAEETNLSSRIRAVIRNRTARIAQFLVNLAKPELAVRTEFEAIAKSEFMESLSSFGSRESSIVFLDDTSDTEGCRVEVRIRDGKIQEVFQRGQSSLEDVTYIESPLYLHILNTLRLASTTHTVTMKGIPSSMKGESIPYHLADMAEKILSGADDLMGLPNAGPYGEDYRELLESINSVIKGEFILNNKTKQLSFEENGHAVPPVSVASGIKSFGVLQRLLQTESVSTYKLLIWDEPEIHLHPEWQVEFSRLIVELVARGIPVVVSSHSPYFVQALRYFASAKGIEKDVKYYMAEDSEVSGMAVIKEVTEDLNKVFTRLAAPLREIMNVDAVRNSLK